MDIKSKGRPENPKYEVVKQLIAKLIEKNPDLSPAKIHKATYKKIRENFLEKYPSMPEDEIRLKVNEYLPSPSWVREYKKKVQPNMRAIRDSGLDNPWHLGTLDSYPIAEEAISFILNCKNNRKLFTHDGEVTIRMAIWISRLYRIVKNPEQLIEIAWNYAYAQRINELAGTNFDTTEYDKRLNSPKELINFIRVSKTHFQLDFNEQRRAFKDITGGIKYVAPTWPVEYFVIKDDKVLAPIKVKNQPEYIEIPADAAVFLDSMKKEKNLVKEIKTLESGETYIVLRENVYPSFENESFNEFLYNIFKRIYEIEKDGEK